MPDAEPHRQLLAAALATEADAQREFLAGDVDEARRAFGAAADLYRRSWELAPPRSFGRLIGMLKAAVIADDAADAAAYARRALADGIDSPASAYALAIAALVQADDPVARMAAAGMRGGSAAFDHAAAAIEAIADRDRAAYETALTAIVRDFEHRSEHLTGVAIADTAVMLERLAHARSIATRVGSPLLPRQ